MATQTERIYLDLRGRITSGELSAGDKLPTEQQLMVQYAVSRGTARQAVQILINDGLVSRVPGRLGGMVVREKVRLTYPAWRAELPSGLYSDADSFFGSTREQGFEPSQEFHLRLVELDADDAARLHVEEGETAAARICLRSVNGGRASIQDTRYPMWLTTEVPELLSPSDIAVGTTALLADRGYEQVAIVDDIEARMPLPAEADLLQLERGTPVLDYTRIGYAADGRPLRVTHTVMAGDKNRIRYVLGQVSVIDQGEAE